MAQPGPSNEANTANWLSRHESKVMWVLIAAIVIVMVVHLLSLTIYPLPFIDEGWLANASWTWVKTGVNFDSFNAETLGQFENPWIWRYFLGQAPYALSYMLFGLGYFQTRLAGWVCGGILLFATFGVGRRLYGSTTGLLAALLLSLTFIFVITSRWRQDIMLAAAIMLAFWILLIAMQENKLWGHFVGAFLITIGLDIHQFAFLFIPAWAVMYVVYYGRGVFVQKGTWLAALGGAVGVGIYAAVHILPAPETFSTLMSFQTVEGGGSRFPFMDPLSLPGSVLDEFKRYFRLNNPEEIIVSAGGVLFLLLRRRKTDILLLTFLAAVVATFTLLSFHKWDIYAILLFPFFMIPAAEMLVCLVKGKLPGSGRFRVQWRTVALVLLAGFIAVKGVWLGKTIYDHRNFDFYKITTEMRSVIPDDSRVIGMPTWWLGFAGMDYHSFYNISFYRFYFGYTTEEAFEAIHPDYIIADSSWRFQMADGPDEKPLIGNSWLPREEYDAIMAEHATLVLDFVYPEKATTIQIYKMDWSGVEPPE